MSSAEWPDWADQTAVIVATGPSASSESLEIARGHRFIVIKSSWRLAPWGDALYGLDRGWWIANQGGSKFHGLKFSPSPSVCRVYPDIRQVRLRPFARILTEETGVIGCGLRTGGGHSGFHAINLAIQFGVRRILLVGFDMGMSYGAHWHTDYRGVGKPDAKRIESWREAMDNCAEQIASLGIEAINCCPTSRLTKYPKMTLCEAMTWHSPQKYSPSNATLRSF